MSIHPVLNVLELMTTRWRRNRERARTNNELANLRPDEIEAIASDCGMNSWEFLEAVNRGHQAADELAVLMEKLEIETGSLRKTELNDMKRVCGGCWHKWTCRRSISKGTIGTDYPAFCLNSEQLRELASR